MLIKNDLIFGAVSAVLKLAARIIYKIISFFHLGLAFLYAVIGVIIHLIWNVMVKDTSFFKVYHIIGAFVLLYAVLATALSILGVGRTVKPEKERSTVDIVDRSNEVSVKEVKQSGNGGGFFGANSKNAQRENNDYELGDSAIKNFRQGGNVNAMNGERSETESEPQLKYPLVSRVKQNPRYVMAEYKDRFELYYETERGYRYIKTDYKGR